MSSKLCDLLEREEKKICQLKIDGKKGVEHTWSLKESSGAIVMQSAMVVWDVLREEWIWPFLDIKPRERWKEQTKGFRKCTFCHMAALACIAGTCDAMAFLSTSLVTMRYSL